MSTGNKPHYLDPKHPNFKRWKKSRDISIERGKFVRTVVEKYKDLKNLKILDIGSGFGGTVQNFIGDGNIIYSIEIDEFKFNAQPEHSSVKKFLCDAFNLPFDDNFDIIILQDFIEHIENPEKFLFYIKSFLKDDGIIYISTPNRFSILNIFADPHWGFPIVSLLPKKIIKKIFLPIFRKNEINRKDIAQLLSLNELIKIFTRTNFVYHLNTDIATQTLFEYPEQIIWSNLHITLLKFIKSFGLKVTFINLSNNKIGFVNKFLTPTFYFVLQKS